MYWVELWAKVQIAGAVIGLACILILLGLTIWAYISDHRRNKR